MFKFVQNVVAAAFVGLVTQAQADVPVFYENFESGTNGWVIAGISNGDTQVEDGGLWHLSQRWSASTNTAFYYGQESTGTVGTNSWNYGSITSPAIDLSNVTNAVLTFSHLTRGDICLPIDDDMVWVDVSTDDFETCSTPMAGLPNGWSMWGNAGSYEGPSVSVDLSQYAGQTIKIRISCSFSQSCGEHLDTSECTPTEGYYIDDVSVMGNVEIPEP